MRILICNWRDTRNPEGGGSERYVETVAEGLVGRGHDVTIACAEHPNAARDEVRNGVRFVRRGSKLDIYVRIFGRLLLRRYGRVDLVVDVQNGLPFFTRLATRRPVVVLVHHVHREQWPVVYPGLFGRLGWWIESRVAPRLYRRSRYVAVSTATKLELAELGIEKHRISVVHNGNDPAPARPPAVTSGSRLVVLGRLVPHKQVEHAIDALVAVRSTHQDTELDVIGSGWWEPQLRAYAAEAGVADAVTFHGFVPDEVKHGLLARATVMLLPSLKEGWGIVIGEAGSHGVPTIAYETAGGTTESIDHKSSGLLVQTPEELTDATRDLLDDPEWRLHLGEGALRKSESYSWDETVSQFAAVLEA